MTLGHLRWALHLLDVLIIAVAIRYFGIWSVPLVVGMALSWWARAEVRLMEIEDRRRDDQHARWLARRTSPPRVIP
jgi:hypothetical protein